MDFLALHFLLLPHQFVSKHLFFLNWHQSFEVESFFKIKILPLCKMIERCDKVLKRTRKTVTGISIQKKNAKRLSCGFGEFFSFGFSLCRHLDTELACHHF